MKRTAQDILNFVEDNDVKFVKLTFCDIFGNQKNISLFASELPRAFAQGISFDGSSIAGFMNVEESDLVLWPDPDTATVLPWRPTEGRVIRMYCDITLPNGKPFEGNCRGYLQSVVGRAKALGLACNVGCECEFYLFETDEMSDAADELKEVTDKVCALEDESAKAHAFHDEVLPIMARLRAAADVAEELVDEEYWPLPCYSRMLFYTE